MSLPVGSNQLKSDDRLVVAVDDASQAASEEAGAVALLPSRPFCAHTDRHIAARADI